MLLQVACCLEATMTMWFISGMFWRGTALQCCTATRIASVASASHQMALPSAQEAGTTPSRQVLITYLVWEPGLSSLKQCLFIFISCYIYLFFICTLIIFYLLNLRLIPNNWMYKSKWQVDFTVTSYIVKTYCWFVTSSWQLEMNSVWSLADLGMRSHTRGHIISHSWEVFVTRCCHVTLLSGSPPSRPHSSTGAVDMWHWWQTVYAHSKHLAIFTAKFCCTFCNKLDTVNLYLFVSVEVVSVVWLDEWCNSRCLCFGWSVDLWVEFSASALC